MSYRLEIEIDGVPRLPNRIGWTQAQRIRLDQALYKAIERFDLPAGCADGQ